MMITFRKFIKELITEADAPPAAGGAAAPASPPPAGGPSPLGDVGGGLGGGSSLPPVGGPSGGGLSSLGGSGGGLPPLGGPSPSLGGDLSGGQPAGQQPNPTTEIMNSNVWYNLHNYFKPIKK